MFISLIAIFTMCLQQGIPTPDYYDYKEPMRLTAICSGFNSNIVKCTWIPLHPTDRTEAEQKIYLAGVQI